MAKEFDFSTLTDEDKTFLRSLKATLVLASREMSDTRLKQLMQSTLQKGNVVVGVAKELYVAGFDGQAQFMTLPLRPAQSLAEKIDASGIPKKMVVIHYEQTTTDDVIRTVRPNSVVVVRGSYLYPFHRGSTHALLEKRGIPFEYVSPFVDEAEAKAYLRDIEPQLPLATTPAARVYTESEILGEVARAARQSFDYSFQTGAVLAQEVGPSAYERVDAACNEVVPYQTYALQYGNAREVHRTEKQGDQAHYDTIHAEMNLLVRAMQRGTDFAGKTLFINMMPCPSCARTLVKTGLKEVVYQQVHSDGYAVDLFEKAGIKTRKVDA